MKEASTKVLGEQALKDRNLQKRENQYVVTSEGKKKELAKGGKKKSSAIRRKLRKKQGEAHGDSL